MPVTGQPGPPTSDPSTTASGRRAPGEVRAAILAAADALFHDQGYDKTSTRQIARRAGTTSTTLFRYFGSKEALHAQVAEANGTIIDGPVSARRPNRTEAENRGLLLAAATELFSSQGYAGTSTSQIAERAGVAEVALFRYFENKANLFRIAIFDPLGALIRHYAEQWNADDVPGLSHIVSDEFMHMFYNSMIENRHALMTLFTTRIHESPDVTSGGDQQAAMSEILGPLEAAVSREIDPERYPGVDVAIAVRLTIAMIGGTVFFKDWLFPHDRQMGDERVIQEMQRYVRAAVAREP